MRSRKEMIMMMSAAIYGGGNKIWESANADPMDEAINEAERLFDKIQENYKSKPDPDGV